VKTRGLSKQWQKWELEGKLPSLPPFLFYVLLRKMTKMTLSYFLEQKKKKEAKNDNNKNKMMTNSYDVPHHNVVIL
jgi:hypothetical protein